jgi:hypothetical protein
MQQKAVSEQCCPTKSSAAITQYAALVHLKGYLLAT